MNDYLYTDLSHQIIGLAMGIHSDLRSGFLEKIYEETLMNEFKTAGIEADNQVPLEVISKGNLSGFYVVDIVVEDKVILELKAMDGLTNAHKAQLISYLRTMG